MNPPPLPPSTENRSFGYNAARASIIAPVLLVVIGAIRSAASQNDQSRTMIFVVGGLCGILLLIGLVSAIVALATIPRHGSQGVLAPGIIGLCINGLLTVVFVTNFISGYQKAVRSRIATQQFQSSVADFRSSISNSFDPKAGITNIDIKKFDKLSTDLRNASQTLSGKDAMIANAFASTLDRMREPIANYQSAVKELRDADVLNHFDSTDKSQLDARRKIVQRFLRANDAVIQVITNSEPLLRDDLTRIQLPSSQIESVIEKYDFSAAPSIALETRQCDVRAGNAMLDVFDLLEAQWGHWKSDPVKNVLRINAPQARETYNKDLAIIREESEKQVKLQAEIFRRQSAQH